jgi:hypothetical protein
MQDADLIEVVTELCQIFGVDQDADPVEALYDLVNVLQERKQSALKIQHKFAEYYKYNYPSSSVSDFAFAREVWYAAVNVCFKSNQRLK